MLDPPSMFLGWASAALMAFAGFAMPLVEGLNQEIEFSRRVLRTEDAREGPTAFAQKRKPDYKGR